jgi:hypothetical protein
MFLEVESASEPIRMPLMGGPEDQQREFLEARMRLALIAQPEMAHLEERLLAVGGAMLVTPLEGIEEDLDKILSRGEVFDGGNALLRKGKPIACHANSAALWEKRPERYTICTGYALSRDGLWRQHSWVFDSHLKRPLETTTLRLAYFGYRLDDLEAEVFASAND